MSKFPEEMTSIELLERIRVLRNEMGEIHKKVMWLYEDMTQQQEAELNRCKQMLFLRSHP